MPTELRSGSLPNAVISLAKLTNFDVRSNELSASLPDATYSWTLLSSVLLSSNKLAGAQDTFNHDLSLTVPKLDIYLVDVSDIFYFFCSAEGKGKSEALGGGGG